MSGERRAVVDSAERENQTQHLMITSPVDAVRYCS